MSRIRIVGGTITKTTEGAHHMYSEENIVFNSGKTITEAGEENGIVFGEPKDAPILKLENGVDIFTEFKPLSTFGGEFGFDWLECDEKDVVTKVQDVDIENLEYLFNDSKMEYVAVSTNMGLKNEIKQEYKKHQINYPYYVPWLNIFPNYREIKLNMFVRSIIGDNDISKEMITFEKNDSYQVTIDGLVNENIKYLSNGQPKEISIKCIKPSVESDIIAKNEKGKIIGKIRVKDNTNVYNLPVRLVFVVKNSSFKDTQINQLISDFKSDGIEDYLNKNSLNQALIKTTVEIDAKHYLAFDEDDWNGKFYDKTNDWFINRKLIGGKVTYTDDEGIEHKDVEYEHILDKFLRDYSTKFETDGTKFKGILLFLTNIQKNPADNEGGVSRTNPVTFREAIVFKKKLKDKSTYAHEIAHALGLEHIFWRDAEYKIELEKTKESLKKNEEILVNNKQIIIKNNEALKSNQNNIKIREAELINGN